MKLNFQGVLEKCRIFFKREIPRSMVLDMLCQLAFKANVIKAILSLKRIKQKYVPNGQITKITFYTELIKHFARILNLTLLITVLMT